MSELPLYQVQMAREVGAWGTAVTPMTVKLMDVTDVEFEPVIESEVLRSKVGSYSTSRKALLKIAYGKWKMSGNLSYEDAPYFIEMLHGNVAPTGAGPYVRTYNPPGGTAITPRRHTINYGSSTDGIGQIVSAVASKLKISAKANEVVTYEVEGFGQRIIDGATFAALSDRTTRLVSPNDFTLYLDAWGGTIGTTALATSLLSFDLEIDTKRDIKKYLGNVNPGGFKSPDWTGKLSMYLEYGSSTSALLTSILTTANGPFQRQIRLLANQAADAQLRFDFAGTSEKAPKLWDDEDDMASLQFEMTDTHHGTLAGWLQWLSTTNVATLA